MLLPLFAIAAGLLVLLWSADRFVEAAAALARYLGMPPLLIGMVVVGFGTSAPELVVSVLSALQGSPGIALGNAYGSNVANIGLILGTTALIAPLVVHSQVLRSELPMLLLVTALSAVLLADASVSTLDAAMLLLSFGAYFGWAIWRGLQRQPDDLAREVDQDIADDALSRPAAWAWTLGGLVLLILSSYALVWGAVEVARSLGVSDLFIGLTIVAVGTSLPELASSIASVRRGKADIALGNVIGSNLFNTLAVVGLAGIVEPFGVEAAVLARDLPVLGAMTFALVAFSFGLSGRNWRLAPPEGITGRITRSKGALLLLAYVAYTVWLLLSA